MFQRTGRKDVKDLSNESFFIWKVFFQITLILIFHLDKININVEANGELFVSVRGHIVGAGQETEVDKV